jgi:hypothetical protein
VAACKEAAADAQQAGAVLLQGEALQQAAHLLASEQGAALAERQQQMPKRRGSRSGCRQGSSGAGVLGRQAAVLEAVQLLQVGVCRLRTAAQLALCRCVCWSSCWVPAAEQRAAHCFVSDQSHTIGDSALFFSLQVALDALAAVCVRSSGAAQLTQCSRPSSSLASQRPESQPPQEAPCATSSSGSVCQLQDASLPAARAAASVLVQLSGAELLLARLQLQQQRGGRAAAEPEFPRVEGRDPQAVIAYLSAAAAGSQVCSGRGEVGWGWVG